MGPDSWPGFPAGLSNGNGSFFGIVSPGGQLPGFVSGFPSWASREGASVL